MSFSDFIMHTGTPHEGNIPHSGRHPWGSGDSPFQRSQDFLDRDAFLRHKYPGLSEVEIAGKLGCFARTGKHKGEPSTDEYRKRKAAARAQRDAERLAHVMALHDKGISNTDIATDIGTSEANVRRWIKQGLKDRDVRSIKTRDVLKTFVDKYKYVDIGKESENAFGGSRHEFDAAVLMLEEQGYQRHYLKVPQMTTGHETNFMVLCPPGTSFGEANAHRQDIKNPVTADKLLDINGNVTALGMIGKPASVDSKRIEIAYNPANDGLIELRRGVPDLSLGGKNYAQVRIAVDDSHYMKGMCRYSDDLPPGIDVRYNTGKKRGTPVMTDNPDDTTVLKHMKTKSDGSIDWDNPFGADFKREPSIAKEYEDKDGTIKQSALQIIREEGDWQQWHNSLSSQYWSKQPWQTAERQLNLALADSKLELDAIRNIENLTVRKHFLLKYADNCEAKAADLHAAPFKGQQIHVLLPDDRLSDNEIYAPNYPDGTMVTIVRHPFSGKWETPALRVRNTGSPASENVPLTAPDAVCINKKRHNQLSGADDDGDFVIVIPLSDKVKVYTAQETLPGLRDFDPHEEFAGYKGMRVIKNDTVQNEMGQVTNLITDMTFQHADENEVTRAVKYSMVIIDAEKHRLDWQRAKKELGIRQLKNKYQADEEGRTGAGTIISRAGAEVDVPERRQWFPSANTIDDEGNKIIKETGKTYKKGKLAIKDVTLSDGSTVNLTYEKDKGLYYLSSERDPITNKRIRKYVSDDDLPERLRGVELETGGWTNVYTDGASGRDFYVRKSATKKNPDGSPARIRVYLDDENSKGTVEKKRTQKIKRMYLHKDAYELTSTGKKENQKYPIEIVAAEFANAMKNQAREARLEWKRTGDQKLDKEAAKKYSAEVQSLTNKLKAAESNAVWERSALILAHRNFAIKCQEKPNMSKGERKKKQGQCMVAARDMLGHTKNRFEITPKEYEAIKAGAIGKDVLKRIMNNTDLDSLRDQATPRVRRAVSSGQKASAIALAKTGQWSAAEISKRLGISKSEVYSIISNANVELGNN